jgi:hypothetical protein
MIHSHACSGVLTRAERCGLLLVTRAEFHTRKIELLERAVSEFGMIQVAFEECVMVRGKFLHAHIMRWRAMPTFDRRDVAECDSMSLAVSLIEATFSVTAGDSPGDRNKESGHCSMLLNVGGVGTRAVSFDADACP